MSDRWLVFDVDGVLLDPDRAGDGHWSNELERRHGITRAQMREAFFQPFWSEIVTGREPLEARLTQALRQIGTDVAAEHVLACWFEADFVPIDSALTLAHEAAVAGWRIALASNQEPRRAAYLHGRLAELMPFDTMVASGGIGYQKPEAAFFRAADRQLGITRSTQVVFVDDSPANVEAGAEHGWHSHLASADLTWVNEVRAAVHQPSRDLRR